jgi:hypothetical protein
MKTHRRVKQKSRPASGHGLQSQLKIAAIFFVFSSRRIQNAVVSDIMSGVYQPSKPKQVGASGNAFIIVWLSCDCSCFSVMRFSTIALLSAHNLPHTNRLIFR